MSLPARETDHEGTALALLIEQYKRAPNVRGIISACARSVQAAEDMLWDVIDARILATATDVHLDTLGKLVREARVGRSDEDYRAAIRLRIRVNRSRGRSVDVLDVATLAAAPAEPLFVEYRFLGFTIEIFGAAGDRYVAGLLSQTRAAGSYGLLTMDASSVDVARWDDTNTPVEPANVVDVWTNA